MNDVIVKEIDGHTEVEIVPFKIVVKFDKNELTLGLKGNTKMVVDGDFVIGSTGELSFLTNGQNIHLDSIDGQVHINGRNSKLLGGLPESIEYRKKREEEYRQIEERNRQIAEEKHQFEEELLEMIFELRKRMEILENGKRDIKNNG